MNRGHKEELCQGGRTMLMKQYTQGTGGSMEPTVRGPDSKSVSTFYLYK